MSHCPCRRCNPGPFGGFGFALFTIEERVHFAAESFVRSEQSIEGLERELDELLGLVHKRHETQELRRDLERLIRAQRGRAFVGRLVDRLVN